MCSSDLLSKPICFARFTRDQERFLVGLALYQEDLAVSRLHREIRECMASAGKGSVWLRLVTKCLELLDGEATLDQVYNLVEGNRPTDNPFWREKVRQVLGQNFTRVDRGIYSL